MTQHPKELRIEDFDYLLPEGRIAPKPKEDRGGSKLLYNNSGQIEDHSFAEAPALLPENAVLWLNDTKVVKARIWFVKPNGKTIEVFCLEPGPGEGDIQKGLARKHEVSWICFVKGAKSWPESLVLKSTTIVGLEEVALRAKKIERVEDAFRIDFEWDGPQSFGEILELFGAIPLPPYIKRHSELMDETRYQTVYANLEGSVAAPTAGLHFTDDILSEVKRVGVDINRVTLHVGAGTFKPVMSEDMSGHAMHGEEFRINVDMLKILLDQKDKYTVAVGTTTCRALESIYWFGVKAHSGQLYRNDLLLTQWEVYENLSTHTVSVEEALRSLLRWLEFEQLEEALFRTELLCAPGYSFKMVKGLFTNFHMPKSTLILLVAALLKNNDWRKMYEHALAQDYRFLSYGDSSLILT